MATDEARVQAWTLSRAGIVALSTGVGLAVAAGIVAWTDPCRGRHRPGSSEVAAACTEGYADHRRAVVALSMPAAALGIIGATMMGVGLHRLRLATKGRHAQLRWHESIVVTTDQISVTLVGRF